MQRRLVLAKTGNITTGKSPDPPAQMPINLAPLQPAKAQQAPVKKTAAAVQPVFRHSDLSILSAKTVVEIK